MRYPPLSRDPYETPLKPGFPEFTPTEKLTEERNAALDFGPAGFVNAREKQLILHVLKLREDAIAFNDKERGLLKSTYADPYIIPVIPHDTWQDRNIPIPYKAQGQIISKIKERLEQGVYERAESGYNNKWFCVPKKDGSLRPVFSLENLNAITIRDAHIPPSVEPYIEGFMGRVCYSMLDILGGYEERELAPESRPMTAFTTPIGHLQLTRLPQGATNSVPEYCRVTRHVLADEIPEVTDPFIDDVPTKGPKEDYGGETWTGEPEIRRWVYDHAVDLERVLFRLCEANLTVSGPKLVPITPELNIVGHIL